MGLPANMPGHNTQEHRRHDEGDEGGHERG